MDMKVKKRMNECNVKFPWGKVAVVSWGNPSHPPMLLVHGYMDSAATFIPLLEELPNNYYYVAFDMPGHGKSDPFPPGLVVSQLNMVEVLRGVVEHFKWSSFVYMSHSMGFIVGVFYNHVYPGKISRMVHVDPCPPLSMYHYPHHKIDYWYGIYDSYYGNFTRWQGRSSKTMTYEQAVSLLVRNRSLTEEQAEAVVSRSLVPVGGDQYRLSWETRMKKVAQIPISEETLFTIITERTPPMLIINVTENKSFEPARSFAKNMLEKCSLLLPNCYSMTLNGGHDIHVTSADIVANCVLEFLSNTSNYKKSKL